MSSPYDGLTPKKPEGEDMSDDKTVDKTVDETVDNAKPLAESRTFWLNLATIVVSVGTYLVDSELLSQHPEVVAILGTVVGVANIIVRLVTDKGIKEVVNLKG